MDSTNDKNSHQKVSVPNALPKRKNKNFSDLSAVLPKVVRALGIDKRLKEHTFINLWPHIVPEPFASRSRPLFIDADRNVVVAVQDAVVGQEFGFARQDVLKLVKRAGHSLGLEINGLRFDMKRFYEGRLQETSVEETFSKLPMPTDQQIAAVVLSAEEIQQAEDLYAELKNRSDSNDPVDVERLGMRMKLLYEKELRLKHWREANGYPHCTYCGSVTTRLHGTDLICANCFASHMSMKGL
ncbi:MAG: DUF721 domain-containing protein [Candidatus Obscuribacter sp.]|jgi:hypothetical protein|nr:DUF721 domain-containing protein [Candidatus Obscuribacter sp.]MBK9620407.1 DUF721 domain-containing protein [Candidatus Obscuribacter sp.]MBL0187711.1 DUF721 domain-containing protein [Candidatus Obscuribacter sp.]MBP6348503.1 DUF721 domain-containing protein [Candidatus Obscuribacter sp.]MBP6591906.1 DUF721 domain-containing protein [Candidatus Obscuribacter sp.]